MDRRHIIGDMLAVKHSTGRLPKEYQEVEYIGVGTSSGPYITSGFNATGNTRFECNVLFKKSTSSTWKYLFGENAVGFGPRFDTGGEMYCGFMYNGSFVTRSGLASVLSKCSISFIGNTLTAHNGNTWTVTPEEFTGSEIFLFAASNNSGSATECATNAYIYNLILYDGTTTVRNFVPCYRKSDNEIGMYDLVNGVFYGNSGTGTFEKGADVN